MGNSQEICFSAFQIYQNVLIHFRCISLWEWVIDLSPVTFTLQNLLSMSISATIEDGEITKFTYTCQVALILQLTGKLKKIMYIDLKEGDGIFI